MRLLHQRHDHDGDGAVAAQSAGQRQPGAPGARRQSLPVRHAFAHPSRHRARRQGDDAMTAPTLSRRRFGQAVGALTIAFTLTPPSWAEGAKLPGSLDKNRMLDAWLRINADGTVTVFTGKVELGQGILTALEQIVADELDVAPRRITMVAGDTAQTPDEGFTSGSQSIEYGGTALRYACAEARAILLDLALERFGLAGKPLDVKPAVSDGTITVGAKDRTV